jgi:hypothetical protein
MASFDSGSDGRSLVGREELWLRLTHFHTCGAPAWPRTAATLKDSLLPWAMESREGCWFFGGPALRLLHRVAPAGREGSPTSHQAGGLLGTCGSQIPRRLGRRAQNGRLDGKANPVAALDRNQDCGKRRGRPMMRQAGRQPKQTGRGADQVWALLKPSRLLLMRGESSLPSSSRPRQYILFGT